MSKMDDKFREDRRQAVRRWRERGRARALRRSMEDRMESVQRALGRAERSARAASRVATDEREAAALRGKAKAYWEARMAIDSMLRRGYLPKHWS